MAIRVYPSWDKPTSNQAIKTQKWQLEYFIELDDDDLIEMPSQNLKKLYCNP